MTETVSTKVEVFEGSTTTTVTAAGETGATVVDFTITNRPGLFEGFQEVSIWVQAPQSFFGGALVKLPYAYLVRQTANGVLTNDFRVYGFASGTGWPTGLFYRAVLTSNQITRRIVGIGDSIMAGMGSSSERPDSNYAAMTYVNGANCYAGNSAVKQVAYYEKGWFKQLSLANTIFVQRGVGGSSAREWIQSVNGTGNYLANKRHFLDQSTIKPDYCMVQVGGNDLFNGTLQAAKDYYQQIISLLVSQGIKPILCTYPIFDDNSPGAAAPPQTVAAPYSEWIASYAVQNGYSLIDFRNVALIKPASYGTLDYSGTGVANSDYTDGVHLNNSGYTKLAQYATDRLKEIFG